MSGETGFPLCNNCLVQHFLIGEGSASPIVECANSGQRWAPMNKFACAVYNQKPGAVEIPCDEPKP
jgi:hypothetical protein